MDFISESITINNQIDITTLENGANINIPEGTTLELSGMCSTPITISKQNGLVDLGNTSMSEPSIQWQSDDELVLTLLLLHLTPIPSIYLRLIVYVVK